MFGTTLSGATVVFPSQEKMEKAVQPLSIAEFIQRLATSKKLPPLTLQYDKNLPPKKITPLRSSEPTPLLKRDVFKTNAFTVYYPEKPRVPHHLVIVLNRRDIKGISNVSEIENAELFAGVKKIAEVYKSLSIQGFVLAQFDTPYHRMEIIPHLPDFNDVKNIIDKVDCNRHILFPDANLSQVTYPFREGEVLQQAQFWQTAFGQDYSPLTQTDIHIDFPYKIQQAYRSGAEQLLFRHLLEFLQNKGGYTEDIVPFKSDMLADFPNEIESINITKCAFCDDSIIGRQLVYEYNNVSVFYNARKGAKAGSNFLILPKRHIEKIYGLTSKEINNIHIVRQALVEVLKEVHPRCRVVTYIQDDSATGQTVPHSHEQIVVIEPDTIALTWTVMSLAPSQVSNEEMSQVVHAFGLKLQHKIMETIEQRKVA